MRGAWRLAGSCWTLLLAVVLAVVTPSAAEAQLGGLKKLKEKIVGSDKPAAEAAESSQARSPYNEYVLELKAEVADCLEKALAAENAELEAFKAWASKVKTREAYQGCQGQLMISPEGQAMSQEYVKAMEGKEGQAAMQAMQAFGQKMEALVEKTCGPKPESVEERRRDAVQAAAARGQAVCGYTERQHSISRSAFRRSAGAVSPARPTVQCGCRARATTYSGCIRTPRSRC
jgi:hypothetical protein